MGKFRNHQQDRRIGTNPCIIDRREESRENIIIGSASGWNRLTKMSFGNGYSEFRLKIKTFIKNLLNNFFKVLIRYLRWQPWQKHVATLEENSDEFKAAGVTPVVITFSEIKHAQEWIRFTNCSFPVFSDINRASYKSFGLPRSMKIYRYVIYMQFYDIFIVFNE